MFGEKACVSLILREGREPLTGQSLGRFLLTTGIAKFKLPERVKVVEVFPLTGVGKVDRAGMRTLTARLMEAEAAP